MQISIDDIKKIYEKLDRVSPLNDDCGKLCDAVCCVYEDEKLSTEDLLLYLLPSEELMFEDNEYFKLYSMNSENNGYPETWDDKVYMVKCDNPPFCDRKHRPIQCRTFPLTPHISSDDQFHLVFDESDYPYECPIIRENLKLNDDFVRATYEAWKLLIKDPCIYDLVKTDSRRRNEGKVEYTLII